MFFCFFLSIQRSKLKHNCSTQRLFNEWMGMVGSKRIQSVSNLVVFNRVAIVLLRERPMRTYQRSLVDAYGLRFIHIRFMHDRIVVVKLQLPLQSDERCVNEAFDIISRVHSRMFEFQKGSFKAWPILEFYFALFFLHARACLHLWQTTRRQYGGQPNSIQFHFNKQQISWFCIDFELLIRPYCDLKFKWLKKNVPKWTKNDCEASYFQVL